MRRLLSLDYLLERPTLGWLPTEDEKVQQFEALGISCATLPYRKYGATDKAQPRYFALKLPIAVDAQAATFVYVDLGLIRFGGHLPKGEYDVDHDGHEGQTDAAEFHG